MDHCWYDCFHRQAILNKTGFAFQQVDKGPMEAPKRGWFREAVIKLFTNTGKVFYVQSAAWRDKKEVTFLSLNRVASSQSRGIFVCRGQNGTKVKEKIAGTQEQSDYAERYAPTDRSNCNSAGCSMCMILHMYSARKGCLEEMWVSCWLCNSKCWGGSM